MFNILDFHSNITLPQPSYSLTLRPTLSTPHPHFKKTLLALKIYKLKAFHHDKDYRQRSNPLLCVALLLPLPADWL